MTTENPKKAGRPDRYTIKEVVEALNAARGLQALAAKKLGCTRKTVWTYAQKYPEIKQAIEDNAEYVLDVAENRLFQLVDAGELGAICFLLKTKGKSRGYVERQDIGLSGDVAFNVISKIPRPEVKPDAGS